MFRFGVFVVLWLLMTCACGFATNRSAFLPAVWDKAPSLDAYQRVFLDRGTSETQVTDAKISPAADARLSTKLTEKMLNSQTRERRSTTENIEVEFAGDVASSLTKNDAFDSAFVVAAPRNVILLLIEKDQIGRNEEDLWRNYRERFPFAIEGSLQCCSDKIETNESSPLSVAMINGSKDKDCDCERTLRSNIRELLFWAKYARGITTATVSSSNFTIPLRYESVRSNENDAKTESRKNRRESDEVWQMIDLGDGTKSVPTTIATDSETANMPDHEGAWNVFDVFSKIRMAFFRSLLETLSRNDDAFEGEFSPRRLYHLKPTVTHFIGNTLREIKSASNDKDYVLVAVVPRSERLTSVDLLQREISKDTILIIISLSADKKSVSYIAQGPGSRILREAKTISELSIAIRRAITGDCRDSECANQQRRNAPTLHAPIGIFSQELLARKRSARDKNAVEQLEKSSKLGDTSDREDRKHTEEMDIQARSSTSLKTMPRDLATVLATSILIMIAWTSSS